MRHFHWQNLKQIFHLQAIHLAATGRSIPITAAILHFLLTTLNAACPTDAPDVTEPTGYANPEQPDVQEAKDEPDDSKPVGQTGDTDETGKMTVLYTHF